MRCGFVELTALPRFDDGLRSDPEAVRAYRGLMAESAYAFMHLDAPGWRRQVTNHAPDGRPELEQRVRLTADEPSPSTPILRFRGTLDRPAFAEITEVSPLPPTGAVTNLRAERATLEVEAHALPARAEVRVEGTSSSWSVAGCAAHLVVGDRAGPELDLLIVCSLSETRP